MRLLKLWFLILALILLALCVLWLLPRLVREKPLPPESGLASRLGSGTSPSAAGTSAGVAEQFPPLPPSQAEVAAREEARPGEVEEFPDAEDTPPRSGSLRGRLVDRRGRAVEGARVLAAHAPDLGEPVPRSTWWIGYLPLDVAAPDALGAEVPRSASSDADGFFLLEEIRPGRVRLAVRSTKLAPLDRNDLLLASGQALDLGDVALDPPSDVYGSLEDAEHLPVRDVPIVPDDRFADANLPPLHPAIGVELDHTDGRGRFRTLPLRAGPWSLRALGGSELAHAEIRGSSPLEGQNVLAWMPEAVAISGRLVTRGRIPEDLLVRALPAADPLPGVPFRCRADARETPVAGNGHFRIVGLEGGVLYELRAGLARERFEDGSLWSPPAFVTAPDELARVAWEPGAEVHFELVDSRSRAGISSCEVDLEGALRDLTAFGPTAPDQRGLRALTGVRPVPSFEGPAMLVRSRGFQQLRQRLDLRPADDTALGPLAMQRLPEVLVRVQDDRTGAPLRGALVTATELPEGGDPSGLEPLAIATDAGGTARIPSFCGVGSRIEVRARGRAIERRTGPFGGGFTSARLEFRMRRGATARVAVVDADGDPVPAARVEWIEGNWSPGEDAARTVARIADVDGRVVFAHLAPGRHAFRVQRFAPWLDREWTQRELGEGEDLSIELESVERTTLDVRVSDLGSPLSGAPAVLLPRSSVGELSELLPTENALPPGLAACLDARGAWTFRNVDPGAYVLVFGVHGQDLRACRELTLRTGSNQLSADLSRTAITGRVADEAGQPVAGAEILVRPAAAWWRPPGIGGAEQVATATDENGEFRLAGLLPGQPLTILARAGDHALGWTQMEGMREDPEPREVAIEVRAAGALEFRTAAGESSFPYTVLASPRDRRAPSRALTVFPGSAQVLGALAPGAWELEISHPGRRARDRRRIEVFAGETREVDLWLP